MPTQRFHRIWCKPCNEFSLHHKGIGDDDFICNNCDTAYTQASRIDIKIKLEVSYDTFMKPVLLNY